MSYKTEIQENNTEIEANNAEIQGLIQTVNSLPDSGMENIKTVYIGTAAPTNDVGVDGDIYIVRSKTA